ncbi:MAG TPA: 3-methyl-2-oxobutanoate hydroxymethyltransferase [Anaerovoracaceae bacterium]|nr:3-methyl-2-oxobutanoate hydroxymethyltransferase [Anaerovoracaceae bacterium]
MKNTIMTFKEAKRSGNKISMATAYDYTTATLVDKAGMNGILVGDSLGMVMLGYENTLPVTMDDMIHHTKAVAKGTKDALIVGDMPFMSFHGDINETVKNAGRLIKEANAHCVKLEGGATFCEEIRAITRASIPVMGHIGLTPQSFNTFGGFKVQGKNALDAQKILDDARALEEAGAFAVVLECVPAKLAKKITESIGIPTIGIGAGKYCDGQILVNQDMLGMYTDFTPKFVKKFDNLGERYVDAFKKYIKEVDEGSFPEEKHSFSIDDDIVEGVL